MSQKSGSEGSESDWLFVSSQESSNTTDSIQSSVNELGPENQTAIENQTDKNQNEHFPDVQNESRNESLDDPELSEGNTDSSSDVEILEVSAGSNLLNNLDERNDTDVAFHGGSLSFSVLNPSDSTSTDNNVAVSESLSLTKTSNSSVVDKKTQTFYVANRQSEYARKLDTASKWLIHQYETYQHQIHLVVAILSGCILAMLTFYHFNHSETLLYPTDSSHIEMSLNEIQNSIVQCFGEQHLEGLRHGDERYLSLPVCMYNIKKHNDTIKSLLDLKVKHFLLTGLYEPEDPFYLSFEDSHDELHLDIIINELQFLKLLPVPEPLTEFEESTNGANVKLSDEEMAISEQSEQFKTDDLVVPKNPAHQPPLNKQYDTANLGSYKQLMMDLNAEIALLHFEKLKLQKKIDESHNACTSQASCSTANKILEKNPSAEGESFEKASQEPDTAEKIKPYLDDLASVLSGEILNLHKSLVNELKEVKKWNEFLQNITTEARNPSAQNDGGNWSWREIRENVENIVLEVHKDFKEKISAFQLNNITETVQTIVEDNKKNAEYLLNVVNHYFNAVKEKTQAILETPISEIKVDSTVKGFWNIMDNLQAKWHYVKKEVNQMAKNFHSEKETKSCRNNKDKPEMASENWYFKKHGRRTNVYNDDDRIQAKDDWLFKRAAQRAKHHHKIAKEHKK